MAKPVSLRQQPEAASLYGNAPSDVVFDEFVPEEFPTGNPVHSMSDTLPESFSLTQTQPIETQAFVSGVENPDSSLVTLDNGEAGSRLPVLAPTRKLLRSVPASVASDFAETGQLASGAVPAIATNEEPVTIIGEITRGFKTWGVSFLVHLLVIVVLGLVTFGVVQRDAISLTGATVVDEMMETLDVQTTFEIATSSDSLLENSQSSTAMDMPNLEIADYGMQQFDESDFGNSLAAGESMFENIATQGAKDQSGEGSTATFYGIKAEGKSFVFVVDRSGSMIGEPWFQAQAELMRSIESLGYQQEFFIILFNHEDQPMHNMRGRRAKLQPAVDENVKKAQEWVGGEGPIGGTMPKSALAQALRLKPDVIFLLSDGVFRDGSLEYLRENNAMKRVSIGDKKTVVHTIAFKDFVGANLLQQIAHENGGVFKFVQ